MKIKDIISWPWKKNKDDKIQEWEDSVWLKPFSLFDSHWPSISNNKYPKLDVQENDGEVELKIEIPGMSEKDLNLEYHDGYLTIKGEKKINRKNRSARLQECWCGSFSRIIFLGKNINWDQAKALYKKGIITISIPKRNSLKEKKQITIQ